MYWSKQSISVRSVLVLAKLLKWLRNHLPYLLPQGLRKALVISGNLDDWKYVLRTRLCHRNTEEVQTIARMILHEIKHECGEEFIVGMYPPCLEGKCLEGKFCCGKRFEL